MALDVEALRERIATAESLHEIVETMRTLATVNIRRANQATSAANAYLRAVHIALHVALRNTRAARRAPQPSPARARRRVRGAGPPTLLVFSSNQGLCGTFNERVTKRALEVAARAAAEHGVAPGALPFVCVGYRGSDRLTTAGMRVVAVLDAPSSVEAVGPLVREIYRAVGERLDPEGRLIAVANHPTGAAGFATRDVSLLPFDPARWRRLPEGEPPFATLPLLSGGPVDAVLADLVRELLYIDLYRILIESFAAENAARVVSMQGATQNIEELLAELQAAYREARQDAITNELMDILGGMLATEAVPYHRIDDRMDSHIDNGTGNQTRRT